MLGEEGPLREPAQGGLGDAKVNDLCVRMAVLRADEHVARLDVAVDDALCVRVLHGVAHLRKEREPVVDAHAVLVGVLSDRLALDQLHHEERPAGLGCARIEHLRDVGVVHHRQCLPLLLETGHNLTGVHAQLDDLERDAACDGLLLLGHEDRAEAALADELQQLVRPDPRARGFMERCIDRHGSRLDVRGHIACRRPHKVSGPSVGIEQSSHLGQQLGVALARCGHRRRLRFERKVGQIHEYAPRSPRDRFRHVLTLLVAGEESEEHGAGVVPSACRGPRRDCQHFGHLIHAQPRVEPKPNDGCGLGVFALQADEGGVDCQDLVGIRTGEYTDVADVFEATLGAASGPMGTGMVDQDPTHGLGG